MKGRWLHKLIFASRTALSFVSRGCCRDTEKGIFSSAQCAFSSAQQLSTVAPPAPCPCRLGRPWVWQPAAFLGAFLAILQWNATAEAPFHEWPPQTPTQQLPKVLRPSTSLWEPSQGIPESWLPSSHTRMASQAPGDLLSSNESCSVLFREVWISAPGRRSLR